MNKDSVYFIAEAGVNHNGNKDLALKLIDAAAEAGADAVKFQTFQAKKLAHDSAPKALYQKIDTTTSQLDLLAQLELPQDWHWELQEHAKQRGIEFLSTAFDADSLKFLQTLNLPFYKVPSGELTNAPLLWQFGQLRKPLIISTGMATLTEVEEALAVVTHALHSSKEPSGWDEIWRLWSQVQAREPLKQAVSLLHCTSQYPTPWQEVNLKAMNTLAVAFGLKVGYSDHTEGSVISLAAVSQGATIIEKHFTLDKTLPGPDHKASIEVAELKQLIKDIRALEKALGHGIKTPQPSEWDTITAARQSIVVANPLVEGQIIKRGDLTTARTGGGLAPKFLWELVGCQSKKSYQAGDVFIK